MNSLLYLHVYKVIYPNRRKYPLNTNILFLWYPVISSRIPNSTNCATRPFADRWVNPSNPATSFTDIMGFLYNSKSKTLAFTARLPRVTILLSNSFLKVRIAWNVCLPFSAVSTTAVRKNFIQCAKSFEARTRVKAS